MGAFVLPSCVLILCALGVSRSWAAPEAPPAQTRLAADKETPPGADVLVSSSRRTRSSSAHSIAPQEQDVLAVTPGAPQEQEERQDQQLPLYYEDDKLTSILSVSASSAGSIRLSVNGEEWLRTLAKPHSAAPWIRDRCGRRRLALLASRTIQGVETRLGSYWGRAWDWGWGDGAGEDTQPRAADLLLHCEQVGAGREVGVLVVLGYSCFGKWEKSMSGLDSDWFMK